MSKRANQIGLLSSHLVVAGSLGCLYLPGHFETLPEWAEDRGGYRSGG